MDRMLTKGEVFGHLKKWSGDAFFRTKNIEKKFTIETIEHTSVHILRVRSQFERRSVTGGQSHYHGGAVDNIGYEPASSEMLVRPPAGYEDIMITQRVPHSECVEDCPDCSSGSVSCSWCFGSGSQTCSWCGGSGSVDESYSDTESTTDSDGNTQYGTVWHTRSTSCSSCCGGTVTCSFCFGSGTQTCGNCDGSATVLTYSVMNCKYFTTTHFMVPDNISELTNEQIRQAHGKIKHKMEIIGDTPGERLLVVVDNAGLRQHLIELRAEAKAKDIGQGKKWYQELSIDEIPIYRVVLRNNRNLATHTVWIYGTENLVHAPKMPVAKSRIALVLLAVVLGFVTIMWVFEHQQGPSPTVVQPSIKSP